MIELKDTVELMLSDDWRKRLIAEYAQAEIRSAKLGEAIKKHGPFELEDTALLRQSVFFNDYTNVLADRIKDALGSDVYWGDVHMWLYHGCPLTTFDKPQEEPVKVREIGGVPTLYSCVGVDGFHVEQAEEEWDLVGPICKTPTEATEAWNEVVRKFNGDDN